MSLFSLLKFNIEVTKVPITSEPCSISTSFIGCLLFAFIPFDSHFFRSITFNYYDFLSKRNCINEHKAGKMEQNKRKVELVIHMKMAERNEQTGEINQIQIAAG